MSYRRYASTRSDYYKNPKSISTLNTTLTSADGNLTLKVKATFITVPEDNEGHYYTNTYQTTNMNITDDDYGYSFARSAVYCYLQFYDTSNNLVQYNDPSGRVRIQLGKDSYLFSLSSPSYYTYNDVSGASFRCQLGTYHYHNPLTGSRTSDSSYVEFITTNTSKIKGKSASSVSVTYTSLMLASVPTLNYKSMYLSEYQTEPSGYGLTITTNRNNSSLTHDLYVTVSKGWGELFRGNDPGQYVDDYKFASNVGSSYTWSASSMKSLLINLVDAVSRQCDCYIKCETKYNGSVVGTTYCYFKLYLHDHGTSYAILDKFKVTSDIMINNQVKLLPGMPNSAGSHFYFTGEVVNNRADRRVTGLKMAIYESIYTTNAVSYGGGRTSISTSFWPNYPSLKDDTVSSGRYSDMQNKIKYIRASYTVLGEDNTSSSLNWNLIGVEYESPYLSSFNVYRVDDNDNRDDEGTYMHISFNGSIVNMQHLLDECWDEIDMGPGYQFNYMTVKLAYKKQSDSSWSNVNLTSSNYDPTIQYDQRYTGATFDATAIYDFKLTITDRFNNSYSSSLTVRPPIILIDYNRSGTSMAFGKISEAGASETIIESILPIIFSDNKNRASSWDSGTLGAITQRGSNSSEYYNVFVGRSSTNYRRYAIQIYDNDTSSNCEMRLYTANSYWSIKQTTSRYYNTYNGYYFEINPVSTYCNLNTNSSYFYTNKDIYMQGNLVATQSWVNNQSYATQSWVNNKNYITMSNLSGSDYNCGISGNTKSELTDFNAYFGQNKMFLKRDGTTTFQIHWGFTKFDTDIPSSYDGQYVSRQYISFSTSFGKPPVVIATPVLNRNGTNHYQWKASCSICSVATGGFTAELCAEGWTGTARIMWFAIGSY